MKFRFLPAILLLCAVTGSTIAQNRGGILSFYPLADSTANYPDIQQKLTVHCSKKIGRYFVTFAGYEKSTLSTIVSITLEPVIDPNSEISRTVEFREIKPSFGKVSTWGYLFDRNNDGQPDYLELVDGAAAVEPVNFPKNFPLRKKHLNPAQEEYFINHCTLVFSHWADDNFDGKLDAGVIPDLDPDRDWVMRRIVVRSTKFNGKLDEVWAFRSSIRGKREKLKAGPGGVPFRNMINNVETITARTFDEKSNVLQLVIEAAKECGLTAGSFPAR